MPRGTTWPPGSRTERTTCPGMPRGRARCDVPRPRCRLVLVGGPGPAQGCPAAGPLWDRPWCSLLRQVSDPPQGSPSGKRPNDELWGASRGRSPARQGKPGEQRAMWHTAAHRKGIRTTPAPEYRLLRGTQQDKWRALGGTRSTRSKIRGCPCP